MRARLVSLFSSSRAQCRSRQPLLLSLVSFTVFANTSSSFSSNSFCEPPPRLVPVISSSDAYKLDADLLTQPGYTLPQLMELAGLSAAEAIADAYPKHSSRRVLVLAGPGNNGGDGLVIARHLKNYGYDVNVVYPKYPSKPCDQGHFKNLVQQCTNLQIPITTSSSDSPWTEEFDLVVDAIFGFSFNGVPRAPFDELISKLSITTLPTISIDVPSGWDVNEGDINELGFTPDTLVSLTAPKPSSTLFYGRHYLAGRFLSNHLQSKYNLTGINDLYDGSASFTELTKYPTTTKTNDADFSVVYCTAPSKKFAEELSTKIVRARLAACVNIVSDVTSIYRWEGRIEKEGEVLIIFKTTSPLVKELTSLLITEHQYDNPEVIEIPILSGSPDYLSFVSSNTK